MTIVCVDDHPIFLKGLKQNIHHIMPDASIHTFESADKAFSKIDLDYFLQSGLSNTNSSSEHEPEVRIFQNVLDFSSVKIRDCMVPRNEICAVEKSASLVELKEQFVETGYSKIIVYDVIYTYNHQQIRKNT